MPDADSRAASSWIKAEQRRRGRVEEARAGSRFPCRFGDIHGRSRERFRERYRVERNGDLVQVRTKRETANPRTPRAAPSSIVVVGAGAAATAFVRPLRKEGYGGPITMIGAEDPGPVDRPNLSKDYLAGNAPEVVAVASLIIVLRRGRRLRLR